MCNKHMKIFHYRNLANTARYLANAQKRLGHKAVVTNSVNDRFDYDYLIKKDFTTVRRVLTDFDLYHIHSGVFIYHGLEAIVGLLRGKKVLYHHWGSDLRRGKISYFDPEKTRPPRLQNLGIHIIQSPDLLEYIPNAPFVYSFIDLEIWKKPPPKPITDVVRILHSPLFEKGGDVNFEAKGTKFVIDAIGELKQEGHKIESTIARNVPHSEMIRLHREADIVVDQLLVGWYGMTSLEAMTQKTPVCVYVREKLQKHITNPLPLMNSTPETIKDNIRYLIENEKERRRIGELGRRYVEERHDADKIALQIMKLAE